MSRPLQKLRREDSWAGWLSTALRYWFPRSLASLRQHPSYGDVIRDLNTDWDLNPDGGLPEAGG